MRSGEAYTIKGLSLLKVATYFYGLLALVEGFCPFLCECDDRNMKVICSADAHLDIIPITLNPSIKEIHLRHNKIRTVDASFQFYGQLEHVDFSYNQMTELPDKCFAKQSKLKHLQMDFNSIGNITNQTFLGLKSLTYLSLRGNKLSNLNEELAALTELETLDLGQNELEFISEEAFVSLLQLKRLYLDSNQLATVPSPTILRPLSSSLTHLNLGQNAIQTLQSDVFLPLRSLKQLNLTGASILNISLHAFRGLGGLYEVDTGLKSLSLDSNALDQFPSAALAQLPHLESLFIGGNFFEKLTSESLRGLGLLKSLDLSLSPNLIHVGPRLFANNPMIEVISLRGCKQLSIEEEAFTLPAATSSTEAVMASSTSAFSSRQLNLKLSELGWTEVSSKIADWSQVASIDLSFNPLQCDCEMTWLKDVLSGIDAANQNDTDSPKSQVICQLPLSLEGKSLLTISRSKLRCSLFLNSVKKSINDGDEVILVGLSVGAAVALCLTIFIVVHGRDCSTVPKLWRRLWRPRPRGDRPYPRWCCDNDVIADVATSASEMTHATSPDSQPCCSCVIHAKRAPCNIQHLDYNYRGDFEILHHAASNYNTVNTKTSFICEEDDYFLSLSKDRRFLTPIPVSEL